MSILGVLSENNNIAAKSRPQHKVPAHKVLFQLLLGPLLGLWAAVVWAVVRRLSIGGPKPATKAADKHPQSAQPTQLFPSEPGFFMPLVEYKPCASNDFLSVFPKSTEPQAKEGKVNLITDWEFREPLVAGSVKPQVRGFHGFGERLTLSDSEMDRDRFYQESLLVSDSEEGLFGAAAMQLSPEYVSPEFLHGASGPLPCPKAGLPPAQYPISPASMDKALEGLLFEPVGNPYMEPQTDVNDELAVYFGHASVDSSSLGSPLSPASYLGHGPGPGPGPQPGPQAPQSFSVPFEPVPVPSVPNYGFNPFGYDNVGPLQPPQPQPPVLAQPQPQPVLVQVKPRPAQAQQARRASMPEYGRPFVGSHRPGDRRRSQTYRTARGMYGCPTCGEEFRIKSYLTRHMKKHDETKAYLCPYFDESSGTQRCHPNGGFSRRDTYKTHLKSRHFLYPPETQCSRRASVSGRCRACKAPFDNNEQWITQHILTGACPGMLN